MITAGLLVVRSHDIVYLAKAFGINIRDVILETLSSTSTESKCYSAYFVSRRGPGALVL